MKIALVTRDYTARGGVEKISQYYARILRARGHEVHVWCGELNQSEKDAGIRFHQIKTYCGRGWLYVLVFALLVGIKLPTNAYDAVVVMGVAGLCRNSFIVANSVHRKWFEYSLSRTRIFSLSWLLKLLNIRHYIVMALEKLQYRKGFYRRLIAVSEPIKHELAQFYNVPRHDIDVLPNGADHGELTPDPTVRAQVRNQLGVQPDDLVLCMLVNELERKGVRQTMQSVRKLKDKPFKLLIVGRLNRNACIALARQIGISDKVIVRPSTPEVKKYLWAADAYVLPTQYEAWNLSIMEAQAAGLPVITTSLNQADLVIEPGKSGFLLKDPLDVDELAAAIRKWCDTEDKSEMSAAARSRALAYDWENLVSQLTCILNGTQQIPESSKVVQSLAIRTQ